jgi:hypothetical protein
MSNELKNAAMSTTAMTAIGKNPFEQYADDTDTQMIIGELLKFNRGDYVCGRGGEECPVKEVAAIMPGLLVGWICFGKPIEHVMGLLVNGFVPPDRSTLGRLDTSTWELDATGKPRDPWQEGFYLPMITENRETVFTFSSTSDGGRRHALAPLCREYGGHVRLHPDEIPVIGLGQGSYQHPDRAIGRVKFPEWPISRWVKAEPYIAAVRAITRRPLAQLGI